MFVLAYIDAGLGAMLLQWILAFVIGAGLFFRSAIARGFRKLSGRGKSDKDNDADEDQR